MRIIGLDIHRAFAEAVAWHDGKLKRLGVSTCAIPFRARLSRPQQFEGQHARQAVKSAA
jgi:hypothetical protein